MQRMVKFQEISILKFLSNNANSGEISSQKFKSQHTKWILLTILCIYPNK